MNESPAGVAVTPAAKRAVVIVGMHRSGTSALARALSFFGFTLPTDLMPPRPDNPKGFWESQALVRLNEEILRSLGAAWDGPGPWYTSGLPLRQTKLAVHAHVQKTWRAPALAALHKAFRDQDSIVLKDPRVSLLLPLWREVLQTAGYAVQLAMAARNPLDVAASLRTRNGMGPRAAFLLWQRYVLAGLDADNGILPDAVMIYDDLVSDPEAAMRALLPMLGINSRKRAAWSDLRGFVTAGDRHHASGDAAARDSPLLAPLTKQTWQLLCGWAERPANERAAELRALWRLYEDSLLLAGPLKPFRLQAEMAPQKPAAIPETSWGRQEGSSAPRLLLFHYHLFKNAGTSVDEMLRQNFGAAWEQKEFPTRGPTSNASEVEAYLRSRPGLDAFSSHTANLPLPMLENRRVFPLIFLRHPIDRIRSAYTFERKQEADTFGARLAKQEDFAGYVRALLEHPAHRQTRNFQTYRLAFAQPPDSGAELERAKQTLGALPFVGLVEAYEASLARLQETLSPFLPGFKAVISRNNVTQAEAEGLEQRLERIAQELGPALNEALWQANADDLALFDIVRRRYGD